MQIAASTPRSINFLFSFIRVCRAGLVHRIIGINTLCLMNLLFSWVLDSFTGDACTRL
jgi:hypothetical protein